MNSHDQIFPRRTNALGLKLIKDHEGFHATPYLDIDTKIWAVGYGHKRTVRSGMNITKAEADKLLDDDLKLFERIVQRVVKVPINDNQFSALVCFTFTIGSNVENTKLMQLLNRGWYDQVPAQLMRHTKYGGEILGSLSRRRASESRLWLTPVYEEDKCDAAFEAQERMLREAGISV